ncbi:MAG: Spy/CpxP family protein refolding chaperone [Desulfobacterales bacterium]
MKKIALIAAGVFFLACITVNAQAGEQEDMQSGQQQSMMQQGMMKQGMMHGGGMGSMHGIKGSMPMQSSMTMVNLLPEMDEQLSLSEDQLEQLINLRSDFKKQQVDYQADMTKQNKKLQGMIDDGVSTDEVRKQMKACSDIRIDMHSAAYETEQEMKAVLTDEQQEELEIIMEEHDEMMQKGMSKSRGGMKKKMNR